VPGLQGRRLKPEVLAVTVGDKNIHEFTQMSVTRALQFLDELELTETEQLIGARIVKEIRERLTFLDNVGVGYLQLDRASATLSAARRSGCGSRRRSARSSSACSTSSTSRRSACTSATTTS
jgi:excinuclease UvrABC ATPase subunit